MICVDGLTEKLSRQKFRERNINSRIYMQLLVYRPYFAFFMRYLPIQHFNFQIMSFSCNYIKTANVDHCRQTKITY